MSGIAHRSRTFRWSLTLAVWLGLGLFNATQTVLVMRSQGMHHAWTKLFLSLLVAWLPWALVTPWVLELGRLYPVARWKRASVWLVHLTVCVLIGVISSAWTSAWDWALDPWLQQSSAPYGRLWLDDFDNGVLVYLIFYAAILAAGFVHDSRERLAVKETETARLSAELSRAQLDALRRQIEPHFLFNTLNAIAGLVREERNDDAVRMIAGLSNCLRRLLEGSEKQEASLGEEMAFLEHYLEIQKFRFGKRLQLGLDVPENLFPARVPSLILQPMVENAIQHGIAKRVQGGRIQISAARMNGLLTIRVYNDGPKLPLDWDKSANGIGIPNVRTRLQTLYGDACQLTVRNHDTGGVEVSLSIPFRQG
jgi:two-component system, LytTR family, sensor kinase